MSTSIAAPVLFHARSEAAATAAPPSSRNASQDSGPRAQDSSPPSSTSPFPLPTSHLLFSPPERITVQILSDLASPHFTIADIATKANTSIEALTLWMSRPDIAARIDALESAFSRRARLSVTNYTGAILNACGRIIDQFNEAESTQAATHTPSGLALACRNRESALSAAKLLLRLKSAYSERPPRTPRKRRSALPATDTCDSTNRITSESSDSPAYFSVHTAPAAEPAALAQDSSSSAESASLAINAAANGTPHKYPEGPKLESLSSPRSSTPPPLNSSSSKLPLSLPVLIQPRVLPSVNTAHPP